MRILHTFVILLSLFGLSCAKPGQDIVKECVIDDAQSATFKGYWTHKPVPLAIEAIDFSTTELSAIEAAIKSWNSFFSESKGFELFLNGSSPYQLVSSSSGRITATSVCDSSVVGPNGFTGRIMLYKKSSNWTYGSSVMALTSLCPVTVASSKFRMLVSAVLEVNYVNYFISGKPKPDLESIVLHELGHILGLDHSCSGSGCSGAPQDYIDAVMYPSLGFEGTNGRQKRSLGENDMERANCLY